MGGGHSVPFLFGFVKNIGIFNLKKCNITINYQVSVINIKFNFEFKVKTAGRLNTLSCSITTIHYKSVILTVIFIQETYTRFTWLQFSFYFEVCPLFLAHNSVPQDKLKADILLHVQEILSNFI